MRNVDLKQCALFKLLPKVTKIGKWQVITESRGLTIWDKVFKNEPGKISGRQPLKNLKGYGLLKGDHTPSNFLKAVFRKFYLVHY